jgi:dTDP-glucose 4,6-dehydratase
VRSGLVDTIAWYEANQDWWRTAKVVAEARYERLGR